MFLLVLLLTSWCCCGLLSLSTASLGSFVVWRRMSYFGDALAHGSLLGVVFSLYWDINLHFSLLVTVMLLTSALMLLQRYTRLSYDTMLGIVGHLSFALGLVLVGLIIKNFNLDIESFLFGDLLAIDQQDLIILGITAIVSLGFVSLFWKQLLMITISSELAQTDGVKVNLINLLFNLMLAAVIAVAIKIVGALIISSLLIIPPAIAHNFSKSPLGSIIYAFIFSLIAATLGTVMSLAADVALGPAIVVNLGIIFIIALIYKRFKNHTS